MTAVALAVGLALSPSIDPLRTGIQGHDGVVAESSTVSRQAAAASATFENALLGYRIDLPENYRRTRSSVITTPGTLLGRDEYTFLTAAEVEADCLRDIGGMPSRATTANLFVEAYLNTAAQSALQWGATHRSQRSAVAPATFAGYDAARLIEDGETEAVVIGANGRFYVLTSPMGVGFHPFDRIAATFNAVAPLPFPAVAAPTPPSRVGARALASALSQAFAARDVDAIARLMSDCRIGVLAAIESAQSTKRTAILNRSVASFTKSLRELFGRNELTVHIDERIQVQQQGGHERLFVRSSWVESDRTTRIDLFLQEIEGRWMWSSALHHYQSSDLQRSGLVDRSCVPYRSPWVSGGC